MIFKKSVFFLVYLLAFSIIIYSNLLISSYDLIEHDDLNLFVPFYKFFSNFLLDCYHGRVIINIISSFVAVILPLKLSIHPIEWMHLGGAFIKGFFIAVICFQLADLAFLPLNKKQKKFIFYIFPPCFGIILYCLYIEIFAHTYENELYTSFFGFTFPFIFYLFFLKKFIIGYINDFKNISIPCLCTVLLLVGISSEFFSFSIAASLYCFTLIEKFVYKNKIRHLLPLLVTITGAFIFYIINSGFKSSWHEKLEGLSSGSISNCFFEYIKSLYSVLIHDYLYLLSAIAVILFLINVLKNNYKDKVNSIAISLLSGLLIFNFSLFFAGRNYDNYFFILHFDIVVQMKIALTAIILILISFLYENKKLFTTALIVLFSIFTFASFNKLNLLIKLFYIPNFKEEYIIQNSYPIHHHLVRYINEQIYLYFVLTNNKNLMLTETARCMFIGNWDYLNQIYNIKMWPYNINFDEVEYLSDERLDEVYNNYINNGGKEIPEYYTKEKPNFNKLLDNEYVLGKRTD